MTVTPQTGQDAATWIEERTRHGQHVVARNVTGWLLLHPGCGGTDCEYAIALEQTERPPADSAPAFVAIIDKDGRLAPDHRATWDDVVDHETVRRADGA